MPCVQHLAAISGASRLATAHALGGFTMSAPRPDTSHLLLEASSQAGASGGRNAVSRLYQSRAWRTSSVLTVMFSSLSTRTAPNEEKIAPAVSTESVVVPSPIPNG